MKDNRENWRIDVHHHVVPPRYANDSMPIKVPEAETQLRTMDGWRIRTAITSLTPRVLMANPGHEREAARCCNEFQADLARTYPSRFGSFALLPLPDVDGALLEVSYALDVLRLDGVGLFSSFAGRYLGDPLFDPIFDELNRRKAVVFVHPAHCEAPAQTNLRAPPLRSSTCSTRRAPSSTLFSGAP